MGRRALLVGINHYDHMAKDLSWCIGDALAMRDMLALHGEHDANYVCRLMLGSEKLGGDPRERVTYTSLLAALEDLFAYEDEVAFYFSGHGLSYPSGTYLATQDAMPVLPGIFMNTVLEMANRSRAREVLLLIDCCYAGGLGEPPDSMRVANLYLRDGMTIIAAARPHELAVEQNGRGVFTNLLLGALEGGAADVRGMVSAAAMYSYVEQALGPWDQRPIYKSSASNLTAVRRCTPEVDDHDLRRLPVFFSSAEAQFWLAPSYEVTHESALAEHVAIFNLFKQYQVARLLRPSLDRDLYFAALRSHPVELTPLGKFYRHLAESGALGSAQPARSSGSLLMPHTESVAKLFHETYERLAPVYNYETRQETRVSWEEVPERNKRLMIAVAAEVLATLFAPDAVPSAVSKVADADVSQA